MLPDAQKRAVLHFFFHSPKLLPQRYEWATNMALLNSRTAITGQVNGSRSVHTVRWMSL